MPAMYWHCWLYCVTVGLKEGSLEVGVVGSGSQCLPSSRKGYRRLIIFNFSLISLKVFDLKNVILTDLSIDILYLQHNSPRTVPARTALWSFISLTLCPWLVPFKFALAPSLAVSGECVRKILPVAQSSHAQLHHNSLRSGSLFFVCWQEKMSAQRWEVGIAKLGIFEDSSKERLMWNIYPIGAWWLNLHNR